jgi:NADH-quinone oxidoreductase subunit E
MSMMETAFSVEDILARYAEQRGGTRREHLIPILQDIQERHGYVPEAALEALAAASQVSPNEIYGVATFYAHFRFTPPAEHTIHACQGTACHVRGGNQVLYDLEERLGIKAGEMTVDHKIGLERVACVGCCALAPVLLVDGKVRAGMKPKMVRGLLSALGYRPDSAGG